LQNAERARGFALFDLAIDSKLRAEQKLNPLPRMVTITLFDKKSKSVTTLFY